MGRRFLNGDEMMREGLIRFIMWDLVNVRRRRYRWDLKGFDG